jgi:hypothetical protein
MKTTSIVDVPKKAQEKDLFGISRYEKGIIEFIRNSDTPITIAIQGEWGSGKTSLMNSIQSELCDDLYETRNKHSSFYGIWINTWQYSLLNSQTETLVSIVSSISTQVVKIIDERHKGLLEKVSKSLWGFCSKSLKAAATITADRIVEGAGDAVSSILEREKDNQTIITLRNDLQDAINLCLKKDQEAGLIKSGFLFFIDDLDRIDPPVAVQILELLKNIFDLNHCIFLLAIDYDVVVKGLKPKFGELTAQNEREFRSFFDKIIQMPFSMPVASYSINSFLIENLKKVGYITEKQLKDKKFEQMLSRICGLSVGSNPRSLKRLLNTVSLITIISKESDFELESEEEYRIILNFSLICIQISYPALYKALCLEGNFRSWNAAIARKMNLRDLSEIERERLANSEEFDEEWEQVLYRICERDNYLNNRSVQISQLFNLLLSILPDGEDLGNAITDLLALSAVTDVQAFDKPPMAINKGQVLKLFAPQLINALIKRNNNKWPAIRIQSQRIVSNVFISFSEKNWYDFIGVSIEPSKEKINLIIWHHPWSFKVRTGNYQVDINSSGMNNRLETLKTDYELLTKKYPFSEFKYSPFSKIGNQKGWYVPQLTLEISFTEPDEVLTPNKIEEIAELVMAFMECNNELKTLSKAYNDEMNAS